MSTVDLHSHKLLVFGSTEVAKRFAFAHHFDLAFPHKRTSAEDGWILVYWDEHRGSMCGVISKDYVCLLPDW